MKSTQPEWTKQPEVDQRLVKALSHPLRVQLLKLMHDDVASPNELSKKTGAPLGTVSYHVRLLAQLECIELVKTEPRRGAIEHYYRATVLPWLDKASSANLPASLRQGISGEIVGMLFDDAAQALKSGVMDERSDRHLSRVELKLDEEAWGELAGLLDDVLARALELRAEAADRAVENDTIDELIPCELGILHYTMARPPA